MQGAAFRFGLVAAFVILIGPVSAAEKHRNKQHAADPDHAAERQQAAPEHARVAPLTWQTPWPAFIPEEQSTTPGDNQNASEDPKSREESGDLTVELTKRSTVAAEIQAHYAWRQFQIGMGAAIISVLAAAFTGWAAWAAAYAARAAREAAEATKTQASVAQLGVELPLRAFLTIRDVRCSAWRVHIFIANNGKTPANGISAQAFFSAVIDDDNGYDGDFSAKPTGFQLLPEEVKDIKFDFSDAGTDWLSASISGAITYNDWFGNACETRFHFRLDGQEVARKSVQIK